MASQGEQSNVTEWIQSLPDDQLQQLRKAATREMKRRGLKGQQEGGAQKEGGKRKRAGEDEDV